MLRRIVAGLGLLVLAGGVIATFYVGLPGLWFAFMGALVLAGTLFERLIYKPVDDGRPGPGWEATSERFIDDATGRAVTVYVETSTGERRYVADAGAQPNSSTPQSPSAPTKMRQ